MPCPQRLDRRDSGSGFNGHECNVMTTIVRLAGQVYLNYTSNDLRNGCLIYSTCVKTGSSKLPQDDVNVQN